MSLNLSHIDGTMGIADSCLLILGVHTTWVMRWPIASVVSIPKVVMLSYKIGSNRKVISGSGTEVIGKLKFHFNS